MNTCVPALRFVAIVLVAVTLATVTAPAPAHADALAAIGLASLAVAGVIVIVYLIAANAADRRSDAEPYGPPAATTAALQASDAP